ncbi:hypothetical protein RW25_07010 [Bacillus sp. L_1B0_8]|uniref:hypothetical protein n=1 Tax=unclassified Bacillus (in: firmicutes) TaxID=185979 RepID=UPI0005B6D0C2|nr:MULTISPECIES: hypothetical protein [unclassified Bacillus (in: firmicutes)]KIQ88523.1 hypothetical protein RT27_10115 [Bacillus sp. L_1B0_5]KIQ90850.1 hypothetical protein RW25_07010 [Bacillus sp. L_1B0_8]
MIAEGDRIYVEDLLFSGWGSVQFIIPGEMFGIQLQMEQPDSDGHYIKRVGIEHIKQGPNGDPVASQIELQDDAVVLAESTVETLNLKVGQSYLLSRSKYSNSESSNTCYIYRVGDGKFLGCHLRECFVNWRQFDGGVPVVSEEKADPVVLEVMKDATENELIEQLSLFDF